MTCLHMTEHVVSYQQLCTGGSTIVGSSCPVPQSALPRLCCCRSSPAADNQKVHDSSSQPPNPEGQQHSDALELKVPCEGAEGAGSKSPAGDGNSDELVVSDADFGRRKNETHKQ